MNQVCYIHRDIAIWLNQYPLSINRNRECIHSLTFELKQNFCAVFRIKGVEWRIFASATTGINIDLIIDKLFNIRYTITDDPQGFPFSGSHHFFTDNQNAMLVTSDKSFNDDTFTVAFTRSQMVSSFDIGLCHQVQRDASTMIAVIRFNYDWQTDVLCFFHASSALRTMQPSGTGTPQPLSSVLVKSLSDAIPSAMALVRSVSAVQMRRCAAP